MLTIRRGRVTAVVERAAGLVRLEVDGRPCVAYPRLTGPVALGDEVLTNVQAVELGLGSGGFDVLYANLTRGLDRAAEPGAHVVKLPYTPLQHAVPHAEEEPGALAASLGGMPVLACTLHSQVAPAVAGLAGLDVAYVQLAGGALPVSLSDTVRALRAKGLLRFAVAAGTAVDGDAACVSAASALAWCAAQGTQAVVCAVGPGIVGTGTALGHGGLALVEALHAAAALGGTPFLAARVSDGDARERHRGLSHHTCAVLGQLHVPVSVAWPRGLEPPEDVEVEIVDALGWREACEGLPLSHMGRRAGDDPWFFAAAFAAGRLAAQAVAGRAPAKVP